MTGRVNQNLTAALQNREYDEIADQVAASVPSGGTALDWGCGEGQLTRRLADRGVMADACDFDPEADGVEERAFSLYPELSALRSNDPVRIPFEDESFDVALSCGVLEHVEQPLASLLELRRVLKPGGTLFVFKLPNRMSVLEFAARAGGLPYHGMRVHDTLWGIRSTVWALEAAGLQVDWVRRANMLPLTVDHPALNRRSEMLWRINRRLASTPGLGVLATNIEARAVKPALAVRREIVS